MVLIKKDTYKLSTGKEIHPNCGIIGISEDSEFHIFEGYDGSYNIESDDVDPEFVDLTKEEGKEIALYMSSVWQKLADRL